MIVPMKKVSLVVQEKHREASLKQLRKIGLVHLERKSVSSDTLVKLMDRKAKAETAIAMLQPHEKAFYAEVKKAKGSKPVANDINELEVQDIVNKILESAEERKVLQDHLAQFSRERSRIEEWGNYNPKDFSLLSEKADLKLFLYKFQRKGFTGLSDEVCYIKLWEDKTSVRLVVCDKELPGETAVVLSEYSLLELDSLISDVQGKLADIEKTLVGMVAKKTQIVVELKVLNGTIEFETARAGMDSLNDIPSESTVSWITGFVPQEDLGVIKRNAAENGWALASSDPGPDDMVPTKLKQSRFVKLLNPLTDFLEVTPGYDEVDISGWFLLFFTIFYGMIFGDAAYGAVAIIAAIIGIIKTRKKGVPAVLKLLLLLGTSNFIWGVLTCSWLGFEATQVPEVLQKISLPLISNVTAASSDAGSGIVTQNLMILCFSLALIQLSIGHIIAITRLRTLKILGELGSLAMLAGMFGIILFLIASNEYRQIPLFMPCVYAFGAGFILNFIFNNYDDSIGKSILEGFKNIISVILNIANIFSDIMSYVRLWAVGLAGASIASTVVALAGPMLGHFIFFIFGVLLLVFGHGLNLVLNLLSVVVHGVRLNTLEFSGHVGLTWAGTAYKPFSEAGIPPSKDL